MERGSDPSRGFDRGVGFDSKRSKRESESGSRQHAGASETTETKPFNRIAAQSWYNDPRPLAS